MPHHKKSRLDDRLDGPVANAVVPAAVAHNAAVMANELSGDVIAIIFGCFPPEDIMRMRRVCIKWREAAKTTIVPMTDFGVNNVEKFRAMATMTTALPNLQQLSILRPGYLQKYIDGEDPDEELARYHASLTSHDVNLISNFRKLRVLHIEGAPLNGRYPVFFSFPLLEKLIISDCNYLTWDVEMLQGLPLLKELGCNRNSRLTGNLRSLRVLEHTLEKLEVNSCKQIEGNLMDLADFPHLKELDLDHTPAITGDIRDIGEDDFPVLESLVLPRSVYGGMYCEFQSISEVPSFMQAIHLLLQRTPKLFREIWLPGAFAWSLSKQSPDWYARDIYGCPQPPFSLQIIQAESRLGWSWCSNDGHCHSCEINWLDPEPSRDSSGYEDYIEELQLIERNINIYKGCHQPPSEEVYNRLCEEYRAVTDDFA